MKKNLLIILSLFIVFSEAAFFTKLSAQDTFSIVAADSTTRQVGSAGASCVDLFAAGFQDASFLGDLLPDTGAINTQSFYLTANQNNARARMRAGDTPEQIVNWLSKNDADDDSSARQYGVVGFSGNNVSAAGFTGINCFDFKNHVTGSVNGIYYAIQGNILLGQQVIDSMESRFRNAQGDLHCRLMAALQGAKVVGADIRCTANGTSSLFAFLKVAEPTDSYGSPSFRISVKTHNNDQLEPIDSLQRIFDTQHSCSATAITETRVINKINVYPNPAEDEIRVTVDASLIGTTYAILDQLGRRLLIGKITSEGISVDIRELIPGMYLMQIANLSIHRFLKN